MDKDTRKTVNAERPQTVTDLLNKATIDFCLNFCKYTDECTEAMERNEDLRPCPLDIVGG